MCEPCVKHVRFIGESPHLTHGSHKDGTRFRQGLQACSNCLKLIHYPDLQLPNLVFAGKNAEYRKGKAVVKVGWKGINTG